MTPYLFEFDQKVRICIHFSNIYIPLVHSWEVKRSFHQIKSKLSVHHTPSSSCVHRPETKTSFDGRHVFCSSCPGLFDMLVFIMLPPTTWNDLPIFLPCCHPGTAPAVLQAPSLILPLQLPSISHISPALSPLFPQPISSFPVLWFLAHLHILIILHSSIQFLFKSSF